MKLLHLFFIFFLIPFLTFCQQVTVTGTVTDSKTNEPLIGVNIVVDETGGTTTDMDGKYRLDLAPGTHTFEFKYIGYVSVERQMTILEGHSKILDILLVDEAEQLQIVTVSTSKFEKKYGEETVSIDVLKPAFIENSNSVNTQEALNKVVGLEIRETSVGIRGGSGWAAGAATRVLFLVDDIPMLAPDNGIVPWEVLPLENVDQIEIIKGAASSLYGSSAMNGIINVRTQNPKNEPSAKVISYSGIYMNPSDKNLIWWKSRPGFHGESIVYRQRFGRVGLTLGGNYRSNQSYLSNDATNRFRLFAKLRWRPRS